jgi:hypothetical protein
MRNTPKALLIGLAIIASSSVAKADVINLLVNPGAETGNLNGWTTGGVSNPFVDHGTWNPGITPYSGSYDFAGGTGTYGTLTQNVSLSGISGITTAMIDSGLVSAQVSFWEQGLDQGSLSDNGYVSISFLDAGSSVISTVSTPVIDSHNLTWQNYSGSFVIPTGTRSIDYTMNFARYSGSDVDSYFDNNSLSVAVVPEPSSILMLMTGAVALSLYTRRRTELDEVVCRTKKA